MDRIQIQMLRSLFQGEISVYKLIDSQDASLKEFLDVLEKFQNEGLIYIDNGKTGLTDKGQKICQDNRIYLTDDVICSQCEGTGITITEYFSQIWKEYKEILKDRPEADKQYDQGFMSPEDVIRRVEFVFERGDLNGSIFVVGDDDFFSVAAALTKLPEKVVVVDIDDKVIEFINYCAKKYSLALQGIVYDVQQELPTSLKSQFDMFLTDPVETLPGLELFLSRGVSTLKGSGSSAYFGLTTLEASRKKWFTIQKMLYNMGFVVTDIARKFNCYPEDEKNFFSFQDNFPIVNILKKKIDYNWYKSSLIRMEAVESPKPVVEGKMQIDEQVYRDDESLATP